MSIYHLLEPLSNNVLLFNRYCTIVEHYKANKPVSQYEKHHILPKSLFPQYAKEDSNIVRLPLRAHYLVHYLLHKMIGGKMTAAFVLMVHRNNRTNSRLYEAAKKAQSDFMKNKNPNADGKLSKQSWANATPERRAAQSLMLSELNKRYKSKPKEQRLYKCSHCGNSVIKEEFCHYPIKETAFCSVVCRNRASALKRVPYRKPKNTKKRIAWNKGKPNPQAAENGRKGAIKQSQKVVGRKRVIRDGRPTWAYPSDPDYPIT